MKELNREAQIMMRNLTKLTQAIEELEVKTHRLVTSKTRGAKDVKIVKKKQTKKTTSNKIVPMKPTAYDTVIAIIFASSEDVSLDQIKKETGFDAKKISNIVYKAKKSGLIKSIKKVVYRKTGKTQFKNHQQKLYKQESKIEPKATEKKSIKKSSPPTGSQVTIDYTDASEWTICSICGTKLKKKNLDKHIIKIHKKKKTMLTKPRHSKKPGFTKHFRSGPLKGACPGCGALYGCYCK